MDWKTYSFSHVWNGNNVEYRPYIDVRLLNEGNKFLAVDALVDSGCETTLINISLAKKLKIDLASCTSISVGGAGGNGIKGYGTTITICVVDFEYEYETPVIFAPIPASIILGQRGFF